MYNPTHKEISLKVYNMHLYYDHTLYTFPPYKFLWPEDGPTVAEIFRRQHSK